VAVTPANEWKRPAQKAKDFAAEPTWRDVLYVELVELMTGGEN
jgi:hypothetical protein